MLLAVLGLALVAIGCGAGDGGGTSQTAEVPPPVAKPEDFPRAAGKTLAQVERQLVSSGPVLAPSVSQLTPGKNRFGFGLFDRAHAQIAAAPAALYVAPAGGGDARGPFPARFQSLKVRREFQSRSVAADPDAARSVYVASVDFPRTGRYDVLGAVRLDQRLVAAKPAGAGVRVARKSSVPNVGDPAPRIHTPTRASVGDIRKIDTRVPPSDMHEVDFADVVGRRPVVLIFATPALCQSRVCGPVVDIAEELKSEHKGEAAFIHMEIYRDNVPEHGFRPQVLAWHLPTEPWVFTIDRRGRIAARIEGAFSAGELEQAVRAALKP